LKEKYYLFGFECEIDFYLVTYQYNLNPYLRGRKKEWKKWNRNNRKNDYSI